MDSANVTLCPCKTLTPGEIQLAKSMLSAPKIDTSGNEAVRADVVQCKINAKHD